MPAIQIFDPALCCSSGVCGQDVDVRLVQVAADIDWARGIGAQIERFNLAMQPMEVLQANETRPRVIPRQYGALRSKATSAPRISR